MSLPVVAIVGRPNVGKSTLFNRLAGRRISIVDAQAGVTRDRLSTLCRADDRYFELVDTGGYGIEDVDQLTRQIERQLRYAIAQATLILFLVDAHDAVTALDRRLAQILRAAAKPVLCVANKVDSPSHEPMVHEFAALGFDTPLPVSALTGRGITGLLQVVTGRLPDLEEGGPAEPIMKLAVVGPRNSGKSTFINALAGAERVIVSEIPGTTRDAVDVRFEMDGRTFLAIDTAGVRKKSKLKEPVDFYSFTRAERSIRRADVVLLLIDAALRVGQVTKNLAGYIVENYKPCVIVVNKWDLAVGKADIEDYGEYLAKMFPALRFSPICLTCATDGTNVRETVNTAYTLFQQACYRVPTAKLNEAIEQVRTIRPPSASRPRGHPKFYYATQVAIRPPTIVIFVNDVQAFTAEYQRFIANRFRELLPFAEIPIRLIVRERPEGERRRRSN